ncbi:hypothetical protein BDZ91DRAFT_767278 [Kalaharituber pfeilii]|nr:hypothetical protein BDZ91DRAFT_767278 [Kalaharituber pfeilii]
MASRHTLEQSLGKHAPKSVNLKMFSPTSAEQSAETDASTTQMQRPTLLDYVIENWLHHCGRVPITDESSIDKGQYRTWFRDLVLNGPSLVKLPWSSNSRSTADDPHHERFEWAVQHSHEALVQLILQEASAGTKYECEVSEMPLLVSAALGYSYLVMFYLRKGSQLDCEFHLHETGEKQTALMAASAGGHLRTVEHILQAGVELNRNPEYLRKALHLACAGGNLLIVERLVLVGAPLNWSSLLVEAAKLAK